MFHNSKNRIPKQRAQCACTTPVMRLKAEMRWKCVQALVEMRGITQCVMRDQG